MTVSTSRFVASMESYAAAVVRRHARDATLSKTETAALPADLQDDVAFFKAQVMPQARTLVVDDFLAWRKGMVEAAVAFADANRDGVLATAERARLLVPFRDNLVNYVASGAGASDAAFEALTQRLTRDVAGLVMNSEDMDQVRLETPSLPARPTDRQFLEALGLVAAGYDELRVDRSPSIAAFTEEQLLPDSPADVGSVGAVRRAFEGLSPVVLVSGMTDEAGQVFLAGREPASGRWVAIGGGVVTP